MHTIQRAARTGTPDRACACCHPALSLPFGECAHPQERIAARIPPG
ncbi:hypothetical protein ACIBI3_19810 [Actinomadura luteofluorescens]